MVKAYFFDWMGTLGDTTERMAIRETIGREIHLELLTKKFKDVKIPEEHKNAIYSRLINSRHWLYPDSERIISNLKEGYKLAIISNMYEITAGRIRKSFPDFLEMFDVVTLSAEVGLRKPDPKIFLYTLNILNLINGVEICPEEVMVIGDSQDKDVDAPKSIGMQARLIDRNTQTLNEVLK